MVVTEMSNQEQPTPKAMSGRGRWTRLGLAVQVLLALLLSVAACALLVQLSEWRRMRWRSDFTVSGSNTLDPQTFALLEGLEQVVKVDIFFRPAATDQMRGVTSVAQSRMSDLLFVAKNQLPEKLEIEAHDLNDLASAQTRMAELSLDEVQCIVISNGDRREVLRLYSDIANIDSGSTDPRNPRPATLHSFRGEEVFAEALKKVTAGDSPHIYFSKGHGEANPFGTENVEFGLLSTELRRQGFGVSTWEGAVDGPVPADCDVLAIIGPVQPFTSAETEYVTNWVNAGGRLFGATEDRFNEEAGTVTSILRRYGLLLTRGIICVPVLDYLGNQVEGVPQCSDFRVSGRGLSSEHPITRALVERDRKVRFVFGRSFDFGGAPKGGLLLELLNAPQDAWRDLPDGNFALNYVLDNNRETTGRFRLGMVSTFPVAKSVDDPSGAEAPKREGRVIGVASPSFLSNSTFSTNRDFLLNSFNWLAERDFRVGVTTRDPEQSFIDLNRGSDVSVIFHSSVWGLPAIFGLLGVVTFFRRRR
ncbi:MAG: hypothetical protein ACI8TQ_001055 [Planctomycetota bacterium]|jgi:hypothetical protein